jgi:hypothetical protein
MSFNTDLARMSEAMNAALALYIHPGLLVTLPQLKQSRFCPGFRCSLAEPVPRTSRIVN